MTAPAIVGRPADTYRVRAADSRRAWQAMDYIDQHPDQHDQDGWGIRTPCRTTYCFAGWVCRLNGDTLEWNPIVDLGEDWVIGVTRPDGLLVSVHARAAQLLNIPHRIASLLFYRVGERDALRNYVTAVFGPRPD